MEKKYLLSIAVLALAWLPTKAPAQTNNPLSENWVICNSCVSEYDFEIAAMAWYNSSNRLGNLDVSVGNPDTGQVYRMYIERAESRSLAILSAKEKAQIEQNVVIASPEKIVVSPSDLQAAAANPPASVSYSNADPYASEVFTRVVRGSRNHILFNVNTADTNIPAFTSFQQGAYDMQELCPRLWLQETISNPGFNNFAPSVTAGLKNAVKAALGKGILISVVFGNGDVATFEIDPMAPSACPYVKGTAKNAAGQALPDVTPNVGGGSSGGTRAKAGAGGSPVYYSVGSSDWLVCGYVGGQILGCYVESRIP